MPTSNLTAQNYRAPAGPTSFGAGPATTTLTLGGGNSNTSTLLRIAGSTKLSLSTTQVAVVNADLTCVGAGANSERFGVGSLAAGANAVALGNSAGAAGDNSVVIGYTASCANQLGVAVGRNATVSSNGGVAVGNQSTASGSSVPTAIGSGATASGASAVAIGGNTSISGANSVGVGYGVICAVADCVSIGDAAGAKKANSIAIGSLATVESGAGTGSGSIVIGKYSIARDGVTDRSVIVGQGVEFTAVGGGVIVGGSAGSTAFVNTVIVGLSSTVTASGGTAIGATASAGSSAVAVGYSTTASGTDAIAIGVGTTCTSSGIVIGSGGSTVAGSAGIALGFGCSIGASYTDCVMINSTATASRQFFVGSSAHAINTVLIGEGESTTALTQSSVTYRATRIATSETDESGQSIIWQSGAGTGAATVSTISFETPTATASGTTQQALATRFTIAEALLTIADAHNIAVGTTTGTKFGTATTQKLGWWNSAPVVQSAVASLTNNVTSGGTTDVIDNFTDLTVYANDATTIRNDIYQLSRKLKDVVDAMRLYGLLG